MPTTGCEASSVHQNNSAVWRCKRALDTLPGTDWANIGEGIGSWIKVAINFKIIEHFLITEQQRNIKFYSCQISNIFAILRTCM